MNDQVQTKDGSRYDHLFKIILVGDSNVGKSCLLSKYVKGVFPTSPLPTIAVEFATKTFQIKGRAIIKAQIWDTAGQEKKAVGALLVYDVTKKSSFLNVQKWLIELRQYAEPDCVIMLVGNKVDLVDKNLQQREVFEEDVRPFINDHKVLFYETSALSNEKVNEAFEDLLTEIYNTKQRCLNSFSAPPLNYSSYKGASNGNFIKIEKYKSFEDGTHESKCCR